MSSPLRRSALAALAGAALLPPVLASCNNGGSGAGLDRVGPAFTTTPSITPSTDPDTPLVATIDVTTNEPAILELDVDDGFETFTLTPETTATTHHVLPVLGVHPDRTNSIAIRARDRSGNQTVSAGTLTLTTPPLPSDFPPIKITVDDPSRMEPGLVLFPTFYADQSGTTATYIVVLDEDGEVVWYHRLNEQVTDLRRLPNGHLLFLYGEQGMREINLYGKTVAEWWAANLDPRVPMGAVPVAADTFHHEVFPLPPGNGADFLVLSTEMRTYSNYPASELDPTQTVPTANVVGDVVLELNRDGTIVKEHHLLDLLDPYRLSYDGTLGFWDTTYGTTTYDWSHANAVVPDLQNDAILVSCRHQDVLVHLSRANDQIDWMLGDHHRWQMPWALTLLDPVMQGYAGETAAGLGEQQNPGPFEWNYHQHAPEITPSGTLLMFDNGNHRSIPPRPGLTGSQQYSRAVEFAVDPSVHSVRQLWSYGGPDQKFFSPVVGDADQMPSTHNVLVTDGSRILSGTQRWARVFEVTHGDATTPSEEVFEARVRDDITGVSWLLYRADKIPSLY